MRSPRRCTTSDENGCSKAGRAALANPREKTAEHVEIAKLRRKVGLLEQALRRKTHELEIAGELSRDCTRPSRGEDSDV